jgi:ketosteroid isomerase-like protein
VSTSVQPGTSGAGTARGAGAEAVVERFNAAWGEHDLPAALALLSEDCVFEATSPPDGERHVGRTAIAAAWKAFFADPPGLLTVEDSFAAGPQVFQRWRYDWDGGHLSGIDLFTVRDGLITAKLAYVKG